MRLEASLLLVFAACSPASDGAEPAPPEKAPEMPRSGDALFVDIGAVAAGEDVTFAVPEGALGFNIVLEGPEDGVMFGIERIVAPNGSVVHDAYMPKGGSHPTSRAFRGVAAASVPQGQGVPELLTGTWMLRAGASEPSTKLRAKVRIQATSDGAFHGGSLDLHVHVPRTGEQEKRKAAVIERVDGFYDWLVTLCGIGRGRVTLYEEDEALDRIEDLVDAFRLAKHPADGVKGIQILFATELPSSGAEHFRGRTPSVPGAANTFGTALSGIVVRLTEEPRGDIHAMLHEAGHFFGLSHTTEMDGTRQSDPLPDTPYCLTPDQPKQCLDLSNVMFPNYMDQPSLTFSAMQRRVLYGSPIYTIPSGWEAGRAHP